MIQRIVRFRPTYPAILLIAFGTGLASFGSGVAFAVSATSTITPTEHFELMTSPGVGFQDFVARVPSEEQLADCRYDTSVEQAGLAGGSLYVRLLWRDLEPVEDQYAWPLLDRLFECAEQRNQTIDFRLMVSWPGAGEKNCWNDPSENDNLDHGIPCWLVRKGVRELEHDGVGGIISTYVPDWEDATIRADHAELVRAIGARYANNARLNSVDIGSVGFWGEWHTFPNDAELMPSKARRKEIIDLYASAFPNTSLVMLAETFKDQVNGDSEMADYLYQNYSGRFGWRGDSWGGSGHHYNDYEPIHAANPDLWETGPVAMEVTGIMSEWPGRFNAGGYSEVLPIDTIVNDAMDWHTSLVHNKATVIPAAFVDDPDPALQDMRFLATWMGPRLVLDELSYLSEIDVGEQAQITSTWINRGSAPLYRDFRLWYRLTDSSGVSTVIRTATSLKGLLPAGSNGAVETSIFDIPGSVASGEHALAIAVAHVDDIGLKVPLAITGIGDDGWYEMGSISVSGETQLPGTTATTPVNVENASFIVDGDAGTRWANGGDAANAFFTLDLGAVSDVSHIRYQDAYSRNLRITLDGVEVFSGWTSRAGEEGFAEIPLAPIRQARVLRFELDSGAWLVPEEVEVFGSTSGTAASRLIDMHYGFLLGQHQVWSPLNQNQGSLDPADQLVQTFRFTEPVAAGTSNATFAAVSARTELDVDELIVYRGADGEHRVSKVTAVFNGAATFSPALQVAQSENSEFWSLYRDGAHPNKRGYDALGDFVLRQFDSHEISLMSNKNHLFLGDSWMQPGSADDGRLADRITMLLGGESAIRATNRAVGGRTSRNVRDALIADVAAAGEGLDYVWLIVGTNDYFRGVTPAKFVENVAFIVDYIESQGAIAIVLNSSVGLLDGSRPDSEALLELSRRYVEAEQSYFEQR